MASWYWTCEPGWEEHLQGELSRVANSARHTVLQPGWLCSANLTWGESEVPCVALAAQCLPEVTRLAAPSVSAWARLAGDAIIDQLRQHDGHWRLHTFSRYPPGDRSGYRRGELIREGLVDYLHRKQRRLLRTLVDDSTASWRENESLVQLAWMGPTEGVMSVMSAERRHGLRRVVSRFPGGQVDVPDEPQAPSRAYRKLAEALLRLDCPIAAGETCVDLGSSPGSWAWLALKRNARVTAVDRSPLRDDLMEHRRLEFVRGDAFQFVPDEPVDWLLSDVIAFPARIMELLETWLSRRWCRRFCVTIKFRGQDEYPRLEEIKALLDRLAADYLLRRLTHNRNEATAFGIVRQ
jgi:23S rRNA (cytidine2498-2'-O)-methyltransferase